MAPNREIADGTHPGHELEAELLRVRIDCVRRARNEKILKRYGLTLGQAINVFFAKIGAVGGLPLDLRPSETNRHRK